MNWSQVLSKRWNYNLVVVLLLLALIAEVLSITFWIELFSMNACRWIHFISGFIVGLVILNATTEGKMTPRTYQLQSVILLFFLFLWVVIRLHTLYERNPLDFTKADMLPVIQVMSERFIRLEAVYEIIPEIWEGVMPVYLPALWLPFVPSVIAGVDIRWTTVIFLFIALFILFSRVRAGKYALLVFLPVGLWFDFILYNNNGTFVWSEEAVVYGYYILLALVLYIKAYRWIGILLACCLLSRYGILFYAGALILCFYLFDDRRAFFQFFISASATGILLFTISRAWGYIPDFIRLPGVYLDNLQANPVKYHEVMKEALGFVPLTDPASYRSMFWLMIFLLVVLAFLMVHRYKKNPHPFVLLGFLKLSLVVFYHFIPIPYTYLFHTSVWVSMAIFFLYSSHRAENVYNFTE